MIPIIIPSRGRAANVITKITGAILYVREEERQEYEETNPGVEVIGHTPYNNLAHKRQAIYERWPNVFMVDDDIIGVRRMWTDPGEMTENNERASWLSPEQIAELIQVTFENSAASGCYLFGFSNKPHPAHYTAHQPIKLTQYINASAFGLRESDKLYFTQRTVAAESFWINLLNAYTHRKSWCDMRFSFLQKKGTTCSAKGGQAAHRTIKTEEQDTQFLVGMFGAAVRSKAVARGAANIHQYQRTIRNPL